LSTLTFNTPTKVHLAADKFKIVPDQLVVFFAGPIRNAAPWHDFGIACMLANGADAFIACPTRKTEAFGHMIEKYDEKYEKFSRQRAWEIYYLNKAAHENGVVMFWLAPEKKLAEGEEKEHPDKVYGHITQMELGAWVREASLNPTINLVIGIDPEYPEADTIAYDIKESISGFVVHSRLKDCCNCVTKILEEKKKKAGVLVKRNTIHFSIGEEYVSPAEFKKTMLKLKPVKVFNTQYSERQHLYEPSKYNKSGLTVVCTNWADKTPKYYTWSTFYRELNLGGLQNIRIE
jgi:hypothetical protein